MDTRTGTGKVMAEAAAASAPVERPRQLGLLGDAGPLPVEAVAAGGEKRGRGRPAGAVNRLTKEFRDFILSNHRSPLVTLARLQAQDPVELAARLGCKPLEALDRILRAAEGLAPFLHGKQAVEDKDGNAVLPVIQLADPRLFMAGAAAEEGGPLLDLSALRPIGETEDFCGFQGDETGRVERAEFNGEDEREARSGVGAVEQLIADQPEGGQ